jgi:hypothetical protein
MPYDFLEWRMHLIGRLWLKLSISRDAVLRCEQKVPPRFLAINSAFAFAITIAVIVLLSRASNGVVKTIWPQVVKLIWPLFALEFFLLAIGVFLFLHGRRRT